MNKLLVTLMLAIGLVTAVQAQTVSVYGIVDVNMTSSKTDGAGTNTAMSENTLSTSRLGFQGAEDLGNGNRAFFEVTSFLDAGTGATKGGTTVNTLFFFCCFTISVCQYINTNRRKKQVFLKCQLIIKNAISLILKQYKELM